MNKAMQKFLCDQLDPNPQLWEKRIYKATDCGAWIKLEENAITFGSIVEGSNYDVTPIQVKWPFAREEFWDALELVERAANRIWLETHGCDECAERWGWVDEYGFVLEGCDGITPVHPDCTTCYGQGVVI